MILKGLNMNKNVEIKAKVFDYSEFYSKASSLCGNVESVFHTDTYFACSEGKLKFRDTSTGENELIFYQRINQSAPKVSNYSRYPITDKDACLSFFSNLFKVIGVIKKRRNVFLYEQTRIHLDDVENLGIFAELEVVLRSEQDAEYGEEISRKLMAELNITNSDLIEGSYIDMFESVVSEIKTEDGVLLNIS